MRRFAVLFGATAPAAATTLAAVFLGLALGSAVVGALCARWKRPIRAFGLLEIGVGLGALLTEPLLRLHGQGPPAFAGRARRPSRGRARAEARAGRGRRPPSH